MDYEAEELATKVDLSKESEQEIAKAFANAKFKKITAPDNDYDYSLNIIVNSSHRMFLDSTNQTVTVMDNTGTDTTSDYYTIVNGSDFFGLLEKITK